MWPLSEAYPEQKPGDVADKEFDYVIAGGKSSEIMNSHEQPKLTDHLPGGTAACVLASRLSEDPSVSVLVLCRGTVQDNYLQRIPLVGQAGDGAVLQPTNYCSEPVPDFAGKQLMTPTSNALGGATRINGLMLTRGTPACFEEWKEMGNPEWGWKSVEPYFCKFENAHCHPDAEHRGHDGEFSYPPFRITPSDADAAVRTASASSPAVSVSS